jgi:hypothetical protein
MLVVLAREPNLAAPVRQLVAGTPLWDLTVNHLYALRRSGIAVGASPDSARLRCRLYQIYLTRHLPPEDRKSALEIV